MAVFSFKAMASEIQQPFTMKHFRLAIQVNSAETESQNQLKKLFPMISDATKQKWINHKGVQKLEEVLNLKETCGYITFVNTGVMDIGCEQYDPNVHIIKPKRNSGLKEKRRSSQATTAPQSNMDYIVSFVAR